MSKIISVEEYWKSLTPKQKEAMDTIRRLVREAVPAVSEEMAYGMPAYKMNGKRLLYFAAFPHHVGFYPLPHAIETLKYELKKYKQGKGSVQFPLDQPIPVELIKKLIAARIKDL